jgi:hypothetical protein
VPIGENAPSLAVVGFPSSSTSPPFATGDVNHHQPFAHEHEIFAAGSKGGIYSPGVRGLFGQRPVLVLPVLMSRTISPCGSCHRRYN